MTITALKRVVAIKGVSIHISTSPYPGDVGRHTAFIQYSLKPFISKTILMIQNNIYIYLFILKIFQQSPTIFKIKTTRVE
jgi:hypothetical protein